MSAQRPLGLISATALVVGNMIGSGLFLLPASLAPYGTASLFGWAISALGALLLACVFAQLAQRFPRTGGPYAYAHLAFGDGVGFAVAWCYWIAIISGNAAIAVAFAGSCGAMFPDLISSPARAASCAVAALWVATAFNLRGIGSAGLVQTITTVLKLIPLFGVIALAAWAGPSLSLAPIPGWDLVQLAPTASTTAALTLWAFLGLESATIPAGAVDRPQITIPRATLIGTALAALVTVAACTIVMAIVPAAALATSSAPFVDAARMVVGERAGWALAIAASIASFGALNGWVLMQGQIPFAAAQDGLFPRHFSRLDRRGTPAFGLIVSSVLATVLVIANYGGSLVKLFTWSILLSTAATLLPYLVSVAAAWRMSLRTDPAMAAFPRWFGAVCAGAFAFSVFALVFGIDREAKIWGLGLLLAGLPFYFLQRLRSG